MISNCEINNQQSTVDWSSINRKQWQYSLIPVNVNVNVNVKVKVKVQVQVQVV